MDSHDTQVVDETESHDGQVEKPNLSVLGLDSGILDGIMNRLNGKTEVEKTQPIDKTQVVETEKGTQVIGKTQSTQIIGKTQPTQVIGKTQKVTQVIEKTEKPTQIIEKTQQSTQVIGKTQPVESLTVPVETSDEDEPVVRHRRHIAITEDDDSFKDTSTQKEISSSQKDGARNNDAPKDSTQTQANTTHTAPRSSKIKGIPLETYRKMTREQKIEARIKEKRQEREQEEEHEEQAEESSPEEKVAEPSDAHVTKSKTTKLDELADAVRQNELIKEASVTIRKSNKEKFTPKKLLEAFADSSDEESDTDQTFSASTHETPETSPKKAVKPSIPLNNYEEKLKEQAGKSMMVDLEESSESDDSDDSDNSYAYLGDKTKAFEIKHMISLKFRGTQKPKKTIKDLLRQETINQGKKLAEKRQVRTPKEKQQAANEQEIMDMMQAEIANNKRLAEKEQEKERRNRLILEGKLPMDDEYDQSEEEDMDDDDDDNDDGDEDNNNNNEEAKEKTPDRSDVEAGESTPEISFQMSPTAGSNPPASAVASLSAVFDQSEQTQGAFAKVEGVDVLRKLQGNEVKAGDISNIGNDTNDGDISNDISISKDDGEDTMDSALISITQPKESEVVNEKKRMLDSQNFLPETQADEAVEEAGDAKKQEVGKDEAKEHEMGKEEVKEHETVGNSEPAKIAESTQNDEIVDEDESTKKARVLAIREARKKQAQQEKARRKAYKEAGMGDMLEEEAVESEDEWQGAGGADGEGDDEGDSDDNALLDDATKIVVDKDKIRANLAAHDIEADSALVKKIYTDLKTGAFRKRRAHDGAYELDLSDDEDDYLREFYERRRKEYLEEQYMKNADLRQLAKNKKSHAFYETIATDSIKTASVDFEDSIDVKEALGDEDDDKNEKKDVSEQSQGHSARADDDDDDEILVRPRKKRCLTAAQVKSMISFLDDDDDDNNSNDTDDDIKDGEEDGAQEIRYIKKHSSVKIKRKLVAGKTKPVDLIQSTQSTQSIDDDDELDGGSGLLASKSFSLTSMFKKSKKLHPRYSTTTGHEVHNVTVTVGSRPSVHMKSSVSSLASKSFMESSLSIKGTKAQKIERSLRAVRKDDAIRHIYKSMSNFSDGWK